MKAIFKIAAIASVLVSLVSCEEFGPVFTGKYPAPDYKDPVVMEANTTIAELAKLYKDGEPFKIDEDLIIAGKVTSTDQPGNFYKSLYIQDETGGIELKIGRNGLYNDYKPGQTLYVKCQGLTIGQYGFKDSSYGGAGMIQLGFESKDPEYETSYMESPILIDTHIFPGPTGDLVEPFVFGPGELPESELPGKFENQKKNKYVGSLVTLKGLKYDKKIFALLYLDSNKNKKLSENRIFLSDETWGVTTWALSKAMMTEHLLSGAWDSRNIGNFKDAEDGLYGSVGELKGDGTYPGIEKAAYSVSQTFKMPGGTEVDIRTSGYCKFSDREIDPEVLDGSKTVDVTGILSMYQGGIQITALNIYVDGKDVIARDW